MAGTALAAAHFSPGTMVFAAEPELADDASPLLRRLPAMVVAPERRAAIVFSRYMTVFLIRPGRPVADRI